MMRLGTSSFWSQRRHRKILTRTLDAIFQQKRAKEKRERAHERERERADMGHGDKVVAGNTVWTVARVAFIDLSKSREAANPLGWPARCPPN